MFFVANFVCEVYFNINEAFETLKARKIQPAHACFGVRTRETRVHVLGKCFGWIGRSTADCVMITISCVVVDYTEIEINKQIERFTDV